MIFRNLQPIVEQSLAEFPVVAIVGARQTGKTTLARMIATDRPGTVHLDLERPADVARLADPELYLRQYRGQLVILDEIQRRPELFPVLRVLADETGRNGQFLILGSASPDLLRQSSESLAGRITFHELPTFDLSELQAGGFDPLGLWLRGGFPRSTLAASDAASFRWREAFVSTYLERDLPQLGFTFAASQLRRFWQMLAHVHGQLWNASDLARSLGVTAPTVSRYLGILEDTFTVRRLPPYHVNIAKRLVKRPKVYLRDSGLLHALLGLVDLDQLLGHPIVGASFEGWIVEQITHHLPLGWGAFFYRTSAGAEIDLVLVRPAAQPIAVEIKASSAPHVSRGFHQALADLGCRRAFVVYAGNETYPLAEAVTALPVTELHRVWATS